MVFYSSTITMMHGQIHIRFITAFTRDSAFYCPGRDVSSPFLPTPLFKIYLNFTIHLSLVLSRGLLPLIPPTKSVCVFPSSPIRDSLTGHFTDRELITLMIFVAELNHKSSHYATFSSSLRVFLLLSSKNFLGILLWVTRSLCFSDKLRKQVSKPYKTNKSSFC